MVPLPEVGVRRKPLPEGGRGTTGQPPPSLPESHCWHTSIFQKPGFGGKSSRTVAQEGSVLPQP